jgi:hypothetical protein
MFLFCLVRSPRPAVLRGGARSAKASKNFYHYLAANKKFN